MGSRRRLGTMKSETPNARWQRNWRNRHRSTYHRMRWSRRTAEKLERLLLQLAPGLRQKQSQLHWRLYEDLQKAFPWISRSGDMRILQKKDLHAFLHINFNGALQPTTWAMKISKCGLAGPGWNTSLSWAVVPVSWISNEEEFKLYSHRIAEIGRFCTLRECDDDGPHLLINLPSTAKMFGRGLFYYLRAPRAASVSRLQQHMNSQYHRSPFSLDRLTCFQVHICDTQFLQPWPDPDVYRVLGISGTEKLRRISSDVN